MKRKKITTTNQQKKNSSTSAEPMFEKGSLKIIPLGGVDEIGKNMTVFEYNENIMIVDCGIMFPTGEMLGIDFVLPNTKYLEERKDQIQGIVITHGHEDHIGALPYVLPRIGHPTVYATKLTKGLIEAKLKEFNIPNQKVVLIEPRKKFKLGCFEVEPFRVAHSIPDGVGLGIDTPFGKVVHTGDFKLDFTPADKEVTDLSTLSRYGDEGVICLLSDSTNVEVSGYTISEKEVGKTFKNIIARAKGRVIVSSFASLINRIQQVIDAAHQYNRKVMISGRSMEENVITAINLGYLDVPPGVLVEPKQARKLNDDQLVVMCTGSQGEAYSALVRMASGDHRDVTIKEGDTVVISASAIPGNESSIHRTINDLFRLGAKVVYGRDVDVHVSGHAAQEELKLVLELVKPDYLIPVHGQDRHTIQHAELAEELEIAKPIVLDDGQVAIFDQDGKGKIAKQSVPSGYVMVDGLGIGDVGNIVLRDRQAMAKEGVFMIVVTVDHKTGKLQTSPDIISRGFVYMKAREKLIEDTRQKIKDMMKKYNEKNPGNWSLIKDKLRDEVGKYLYQKTQRRPLVLPVVVEV
jgi:ribonuclease J